MTPLRSPKVLIALFLLLATSLLAGCMDEGEDESGMSQDQEQPDYSSLDADLRLDMTEYRFGQTTLRIDPGTKIWFYNAGEEVHHPVALDESWAVGDLEPGTGEMFTVEGTGNQSFKCLYHGDEPHTMRVAMFVNE